MAERPDENDGNQTRIDLASDLPLGTLQNDGTRFGILNEKAIKDIAKILQSIGDVNVEVETIKKAVDEKEARERATLKRQVSVYEEYFSSGLKNVLHTVDVVLTWLEQSAKKARESDGRNATNANDEVDTATVTNRTDSRSRDNEVSVQHVPDGEKKEGLLRGLYHITVLGSYTYLVDLLELACKFLDVPENPYKAKREHVTACLKEVEEEKQNVVELIKQACELLQQITREPEFNHDKALEFDNIVQQANVNIEACKGLLSSAEETINELSQNMSIMKGFSRILCRVRCDLLWIISCKPYNILSR